jgi:hypothetical protein
MGCSSECSESQSSVTASNEKAWSTLTVIGHSGRGRDNGREGSRKSGERYGVRALREEREGESAGVFVA